MSSSTAFTPEKEIHEHAETNGMRQRNNYVSRQDFNNPTGAPMSELDRANSTASTTARHRHRHEVRRRLKHKRMQLP